MQFSYYYSIRCVSHSAPHLGWELSSDTLSRYSRLLNIQQTCTYLYSSCLRINEMYVFMCISYTSNVHVQYAYV